MKKIICIFVCTLLITIILPIAVSAGDEQNPEIVDEIGDTPLSLLDIESAWFYENEEEPEFLFVSMKILFLKETFMKGASQKGMKIIITFIVFQP